MLRFRPGSGIGQGTLDAQGGGSGLGGQSTVDRMARVYNDADLSIANSTNIALTFNQEEFDTDSFHSTTSNTDRLTIHMPGRYLLIGQVDWANNAVGYRALVLRKMPGAVNLATVEMDGVSFDDGGGGRQDVVTIAQLVADDYVQLEVRQTSGAPLLVSTNPNYSPRFLIARLSG